MESEADSILRGEGACKMLCSILVTCACISVWTFAFGVNRIPKKFFYVHTYFSHRSLLCRIIVNSSTISPVSMFVCQIVKPKLYRVVQLVYSMSYVFNGSR